MKIRKIFYSDENFFLEKYCILKKVVYLQHDKRQIINNMTNKELKINELTNN